MGCKECGGDNTQYCDHCEEDYFKGNEVPPGSYEGVVESVEAHEDGSVSFEFKITEGEFTGKVISYD